MPDILSLDYETKSEIDLKKYGLDRYINHHSTQVLMAAWKLNGATVQQWSVEESLRPNKFLLDALSSPDVQKWAFNAQFERLVTQRVLKIDTDYSQWRCTMCLAYMQGFFGDLKTVGTSMGLADGLLKMSEGLRLIRKFSVPQRVTKSQPHRWRDALTDPEDWDLFLHYNRQDVEAEYAIYKRLINFPVPELEWRFYALDQKINDHGIQINRKHAENAIQLAEVRKKQIIIDMKHLTGLGNPGSPVQLTPWLKERGYPFDDIQKDTVLKVIREADEHGLHDDAKKVLKMRLNSSKSSLAKYKSMITKCGTDDVFRYSLQFHGASRTGRWAGRNLQVQNLPRTPKLLEDVFFLGQANKSICNGDLEWLDIIAGEPMNTLVGCIRSALVSRPGKVLRVADLSSIESVVIGWMTNCRWFLDTLANGRDLYRAFAAEWLKLDYEDTKPHRSKAKPATLGCGYRLGGGELKDGKKTGLWGYAENMGVHLTREESHSSVQAFRELCPEIVQAWRDLENAAKTCVRTGKSVTVGYVTFEMRSPYLCVVLPSGRRLYYFKPQIKTETVKGSNGDYTRTQLTYMGKQQNGTKWIRLNTHGGKLIENFVQAIARDILRSGMMRADKDGFVIPMHVHDEIVTEADRDDQYHTVERLIEHMTAPIKWAPGLPLGAAGWEGTFYRKD